MALQDLNADPMMQHLSAALEKGETIGHYERLVFAMVARHFVEEEQLIACLHEIRNGGAAIVAQSFAYFVASTPKGTGAKSTHRSPVPFTRVRELMRTERPSL